MKIAIDVSQIVYDTGVSRYTKELARHLFRIDKKNDYLLFAGVFRQKDKIQAYFEELRKEGLDFEERVVLLPPKIADLVFNRLRFPIDIFIDKVDVFHASNWTTPRTKARLVTTVHDLTPILYPETFPHGLLVNFQNNLKLVEANADLVLADCETTRGDLLKRTAINSEKIKTIYLAASEKFKPVKDRYQLSRIAKKYGIRGDYILSVGTQEPRKNIKRLVEAFLQLDNRAEQLVLVGKYGWKEEISHLKSQVSDLVVTGFVEEEDLPTLYSAAKVFVYPSLYEGFGIPVLEAMQCSCPVVTSNSSSTAEIASGAALLVNPESIEELKDAMENVLDDKKLQKELTQKGLLQAKKFSWEKTAKQTLAAYKEIAP